MEIKLIKEQFSNEKIFNKIIPKIIEWDNSDLHGRGLYKKMEKYAYIELKISVNIKESFVSTIEWNEDLIPLEFSETVIDVLNFFISLVKVLKNEDMYFKVEMIDGGYSPVDSTNKLYEIATIFAILDCFDSSDRIITKLDIERIEKIKKVYSKFPKNSNP
ncbi:hypothetical protein H9X57_09510 [Flavobacterium piscinae]|uniref:Uncharacterized protein n=1 Tax=Flavobacterium piscinae TaxID=2506424 RepID=A0A4Q1KV76_9FLAO|nr:hypothetical protein [Flavobacterium piscinae]MBC8883540.1 hypothetical protein [Flavobacterium piscinae]RXR34143.1 hypothetical protein EQG68_03660 [Flavobacterium piscinae]